MASHPSTRPCVGHELRIFSFIAHELDISSGRVSSIIHSVLMMSKVSSRWVPRMLTPEQKACRQQFSEENLDMLRANSENVSRIITGDETWVHHHDSEAKQMFMQEISCATINRKDYGNKFLGLSVLLL